MHVAWFIRAMNRTQPENQLKDPLVGLTLDDHYRIEEELGDGFMSKVYRCWDYEEGECRALKVLQTQHRDSPSVVVRFLDEARTLSMVEHPNIVRFYSVGRSRDGLMYIVEELLRGRDLWAIHQMGIRLHWQDVAFIIKQVGEALQNLHGQGIVHRDVKLANIMLCRQRGCRHEAERVQIKLIDFGFARPLQSDSRAPISEGLAPCTPQYAAPELLQGKPASPASDQWALGVVGYTLLTGVSPFDRSDGSVALVQRIQTESPRPIQQLAPECPSAFSDLIMNMLSKKPADRLPSMSILIRRIDELLTREQAKGQSTRLGQAKHETGTRKWEILGLLMIMVAVSAGAWTLWGAPWRGSQPSQVLSQAVEQNTDSSSFTLLSRRAPRHLRPNRATSSAQARRLPVGSADTTP